MSQSLTQLQLQLQKKLGVPISQIILAYKQQTDKDDTFTIINIFTVKKFIKMIQKFLSKIVTDTQPIKQSQFFNYHHIENILTKIAKQLNINILNYQSPSSTFLSKFQVQYQTDNDDQTWKSLRILSDLFLQLMIKNQNALHFITKMDQKSQIQIKQYLQSHQTFTSNKIQLDPYNNNSNYYKIQNHNEINPNTTLLEKLDQLQHCLSTRETQLSATKLKYTQLKQQLQFTKIFLHQKQLQINHLKNRISIYSQTDLLFQQKDQEISKLTAEVNQIKMNSHLKNNQYTNQINKIKQLNKLLQHQKLSLNHENQQLTSKIQHLTTAKQQTQTANKKVITNLKQKIKILNDRLTQQQKSMLQLIQKQQKDKQIFQTSKRNTFQHSRNTPKLIIKHDDSFKNIAKKRSKLVDELGDLECFLATPDNQLKKYFSTLFGDVQEKCTKKLCIAIRQQFVRVVQQINQINNDTDFLIYITPSNRLQCLLNQLSRIRQTCLQNSKLKQKISLLQSQGYKGQPTKQSLQQITKLNKRILVMKRNLQQLQSKYKQQLQILITLIGDHFIFDIKT